MEQKLPLRASSCKEQEQNALLQCTRCLVDASKRIHVGVKH